MDGTAILFHSLSKSMKRASDSDGKTGWKVGDYLLGFCNKALKAEPVSSRSLGGTGARELGAVFAEHTVYSDAYCKKSSLFLTNATSNPNSY